MSVVSIIIAFIIFSVIIIFHELGHFWLAKANGIRVNEFCLGLGPTILGIQKGETKYSIKLLPFGGACMMEGEDEDSSDERAFGKKSVWARISVVFAGPFFNSLLPLLYNSLSPALYEEDFCHLPLHIHLLQFYQSENTAHTPMSVKH